jgi:hypothetical protein
MKTKISALIAWSILGLLPLGANQAGSYSGGGEEAQLMQNGNFDSTPPLQASVTSSTSTGARRTPTTHRHQFHATKKNVTTH